MNRTMRMTEVTYLVLAAVVVLAVVGLAVFGAMAVKATASAEPEHVHSFTYEVVNKNGLDYIYATCSGDDCPLPNHQAGAMLSSKTVITYTGSPVNPLQWYYNADFLDKTGIDVTTFDPVYTGTSNGGVAYGPSTTAPTDAGDYVGTVTVTIDGNDYALSRAFTVNKTDVSLTTNPTCPTYNGTEQPIFTDPVAGCQATFTYMYRSKVGDAWGAWTDGYIAGIPTETNCIPYQVQFKIIPTGDDAGNYNVTTTYSYNVGVKQASYGVYNGSASGDNKRNLQFYLDGVSTTVAPLDSGSNWNRYYPAGFAYDGNAHTFEAKITGVGDEVITVISITRTDAGRNASTIVAGNYAAEGSDYQNYYLSQGVNSSFGINILKADYDMSGVVYDTEKEYNGEMQFLTVGNLPVGLDGVAVTASCSGNPATYPSNGEQLWTVTFATTSTNYNVPAAVNKNFSIVKKNVTVSVGDVGYYDGTAKLPLVTFTGTEEGEEAAVALVDNTQDNVNAGTFDVTIEVDDDLYTLVAGEGYTVTAGVGAATVTIAKRPIEVTLTGATSVYGEAIAVPAVEVTSAVDVVEGDNPWATTAAYEALTATTTVGAGSVAVLQSSDDNYQITFVGNTYAITPKPITVTADDKSSPYGDATVALTATLSAALVGADQEADLFYLTKEAGTDAGDYTIAVVPSNNLNYDLTAEDGVYTIVPRAITVTIEDKTSTYGDNRVPLTAGVTEGTLAVGDAAPYTLSCAATETYIYFSDAQGWGYPIYAYAWSDDPAVGSNAAWPGMECTWLEKNEYFEDVYYYDLGDKGYTKIIFSSNGRQTQDVVLSAAYNAYYSTNVADGLGHYAAEGYLHAFTKAASNAGEYAIEGTATDDNYAVTFVTGTYVVAPRQVTVSGIEVTGRAYDGTAEATLDYTSLQIEGVLKGDELTVTATGTFDSKNVGVDKTVSITDYVFGGTSAANYAVKNDSQTLATATITALEIVVAGIEAEDKTYDGTTAATLDYTGVTLDGGLDGDDLAVTATGTFNSKNVGEDKAVAISGLTLVGADAVNYYLAAEGQQTASVATIAQQAIVVSGVQDASTRYPYFKKSYDGTTNVESLYFVTSDAVLDGKADGDDLTVTVTGTLEDKYPGENKTAAILLQLSGADVANYYLAAEGQQTTVTGLIVNKKTLIPSVSGLTAEGARKVYNGSIYQTFAGSDFTGIGWFSGSAPVAGDDVYIESVTAKVGKNVGSHQIVVNTSENPGCIVLGGADKDYYNIATRNTQYGSFYVIYATVVARNLIVTGLTAGDKNYDGTIYAQINISGAALTGVIEGDDVSLVNGGTSGTFADASAGEDKLVTVSGFTLEGEAAGNYVIASCRATATIHPKQVTVAGIEAADKTYDGTTAATLSYEGVTLTGKVGEDELTVTATGTFADKNAAEGKTVTISDITFGGAAASNYVVKSNSQTSATATINQREVEIEWGNDALTYNGVAQQPTATVANAVEGDVVTITVSGAQTDYSADAYTATVTAVDDANYKLPASVTHEYTIAQFEVELVWNNDALTYDGTAQQPIATVGNKPAEGEAVTVTVEGAATDYSAEAYVATATALSSDNYKLPASATHAFTIAQFEVELVWANDALTYNASQQKPIATVGNKPANGEAVTVTVEGAATNYSAEAYVATATALSSDNYKLPADVTHEFTIARKTVVVTYKETGPMSFTYGDQGSYNVSNVGGASQNLVNNVTATGQYYCTQLDMIADIQAQNVETGEIVPGNGFRYYTPVGTYHFLVTARNVALADNYEIVGAVNDDDRAIITINPATITNISISDIATPTYDGSNTAVATVTATATVQRPFENQASLAFVYSATDSGEYTAAIPQFVTAGDYTVYYKVSADNHNTATGTFTVTVAKRTVELVTYFNDDATQTATSYMGAAQTFHAIVANPAKADGVNDDDVTVTLSLNGGTAAGEYAVTLSIANDNYAFDNGAAAKDVVFSIAKATYAVTFEDLTVTYDGTAKSVYTSELSEEITVEYAGNGQINAGEYVVTAHFTVSDNYNPIADKTATLTINKATVSMSSVTFNDVSYTYNNTERTVTIGGSVPAIVRVTYTNNTRTNAGSQVATASFEVIEGADNYNPIADMTATLTINKANYNMYGIEYPNQVKTYNGETQYPDTKGKVALPTGLDGVQLTASFSSGVTNVSEGNKAITVTFVTESANYNAPASRTVNLQLYAKHVTVVWSNSELVFNGQNQAPTAVVEDELCGDDALNVVVRGEQMNYSANAYTATAYLYNLDNTPNTNYSAGSTGTCSFTIAKRVVEYYVTLDGAEVSEDNIHATYGVNYDTGAYVNGATVYGHSMDAVVTNSVGAGARLDHGGDYYKTNAGTYSVRFVLAGGAAANYQFADGTTEREVTWYVDPLTVNVTLAGNTITYGDEVTWPYATTNVPWTTLAVDADSVYEVVCAAADIVNAGERPNAGTYPITVVDKHNPNFTVNVTNTANLVINKRNISVSFVGESKTFTYGDADAWETVKAYYVDNDMQLEVVGEDDAALVEEDGGIADFVYLAFYTYNAQEQSTVQGNLEAEYLYAGTYRLVVNDANNGDNYKVDYLVVQGAIVVEQATLAVSVDVPGKTYDGVALPTVNFLYNYVTVTGFVGNDAVGSGEFVGYNLIENHYAFKYASAEGRAWDAVPEEEWTSVAPANAEQYYVLVAISGLCNYADTVAVGTVTIERRTVNIVPVYGQGKVYGEEDGTLVYEVLNVVVGEQVVLTGSLAYEGDGGAGVHAFTMGTLALTEDEVNVNYVLSLSAEVYTITKATFEGEIRFEDATYVYDGTAKSLAVEAELNDEITVSYENNDQVNAGEYVVTAHFIVSANYNAIADVTATLTINKAVYDMTGVSFADVVTVYDGNAHTITVTGELPAGVTVAYADNSLVNVGTTTATATFQGDYDNYESVASMLATLTVSKATYDMSSVVFADVTATYDGAAHTATVSGDLPAGVTVTYINNSLINAGAVEAIAIFQGDYANYKAITDMTATVTVRKARIDIGAFNDGTFVYDGSEKAITMGELPEVVAVSYEGNGVKNVGTYVVIAHFIVGANYESIADKTATITITKATYDMTGVTFADVVAAYDGAAHTATVAGELPEGVTVAYENNSLTKVGVLTAKAIFSGDYDNYNAIADMTATITVTEAAPTQNEDGSKTYEKEVDQKQAASEGVDMTAIFDDAAKDDSTEKEVKLSVGTTEIVFDAAAIAAIAGKDVKLQVNVIMPDENDAEENAEMTLDITLTGATFEQGKVTVTAAFDKAAPKGMVSKVYYVDADGNRTDMNATFSDGKVVFETNHFSRYIVVFEKAGLSGGAVAGIVIACVVFAALVAVGVIFLLRKKKSAAK
ncbi:MAG: starch-binding protein [Clostridia bacterium]|nr:starch-binding protein [Clostridia bacterium]